LAKRERKEENATENPVVSKKRKRKRMFRAHPLSFRYKAPREALVVGDIKALRGGAKNPPGAF